MSNIKLVLFAYFMGLTMGGLMIIYALAVHISHRCMTTSHSDGIVIVECYLPEKSVYNE